MASATDIGARIKLFREGRGWSREELAAQLMVSRQQPWKWETGQAKPSRVVLQRLYVLGMPRLDGAPAPVLHSEQPLRGQSVTQDYREGFQAGWEAGIRWLQAHGELSGNRPSRS